MESVGEDDLVLREAVSREHFFRVEEAEARPRDVVVA